jgi:hypothetical protein
MKKIASIALGLGLILGLTSATFAQSSTKATKTKTTKAKSSKAPKKSTAKM